MWPYVAAGVACVMRVVVTTPVDWPATRRELERADGFVAAARCAVAALGDLIDADHAGARLHAAHDRGHRAGRIGRLEIGFVRARERGRRKVLERETILFARAALALAVENARGRDRRDAHAVAEEHDDVLRVRRRRVAFACAAAAPARNHQSGVS